ncbi:hypothetical protein, partial [Kaarinaea lacus]
MRVVWISIVIFLAIFAISFGLHNPDLKLEIPTTAESKPQIENPFVEDEPIEKQVEVAVFSGNQQPEVNKPENLPSSENEILNSQDDVAAVVAPANTIEAKTDQINKQNNQAVSENPENGQTVAEQSESASPKRQLGLLARSAEKRRNKNKIAVIVHEENDQLLTAQEIRAMYMDRLTQWEDGSKIMLYNLPLGDSHREKFSQRVLNMSALQADEAESQRRDNNAAINPVHVKAKNIVVSYVERYPNAIAYVPLSMIRDNSRVKIVMTLAE